MRHRLRFLLLAALFTAVLLPATAPAGSTAAVKKLTAEVGPGFTITLKNPAGKKVSSLAPGKYELRVSDRSRSHNFHLTGPGVNKKTAVSFLGRSLWTVKFTAGTYKFVCDPHSSSMKGSFKVK